MVERGGFPRGELDAVTRGGAQVYREAILRPDQASARRANSRSSQAFALSGRLRSRYAG